MKIVIADDEFYARKAVVQMVADWDPAAELLEAEDGAQVLKLLEDAAPDLILTDIRMPQMDGIQLAAHVQQHYPHIRVAIISGFDDFAYAQEAIRYKVEHYLLKPVNDEELYPLLEQLKAATAILHTKKQAQLLSSCLYNGDCSAISGILSPPYRTAVICLSPDERDRCSEALREELARRQQQAFILNDKRRDHLLIVILSDLPAGQDGKQQLQLIFKAVRQQFLLYDPDDPALSIGISSSHAHADQLPVAFREAKSAAIQSLLLHDCKDGQDRERQADKLVFHEDTASGVKYDAEMIREWADHFGRKIAHHHSGEAAQMIDEWLHKAVEMSMSVYMLQDWYASTVKVINAFIEQVSAADAGAFMEQRRLLDFCSIEEAKQALIEQMHTVSAQLKQNEEKTDIVASIKAYVELHYRSRIQLDELAKDKYFVDPDYLSRLFKRKSGMRFSAYLLSVRMDKAQLLLARSPELSVSEIASEVGFNDYSYFIQMYKKVYGETPGKYRSRLGIHTADS
ncbi:response regulator [Paenibacillus sp. GCM10027626]|uniref:response regulator n=1 Tax=Paenibacillus sp. GCM10027626 TaxID=3273411 RepID=UPI0036419016